MIKTLVRLGLVYSSLISCRTVVVNQVPAKVEVVKMPSRPDCFLPVLPEPPDDVILNFDDPDVIQRTTVHIGEYNKLAQYVRDIIAWAHNVEECWTAENMTHD